MLWHPSPPSVGRLRRRASSSSCNGDAISSCAWTPPSVTLSAPSMSITSAAFASAAPVVSAAPAASAALVVSAMPAASAPSAASADGTSCSAARRRVSCAPGGSRACRWVISAVQRSLRQVELVRAPRTALKASHGSGTWMAGSRANSARHAVHGKVPLALRVQSDASGSCAASCSTTSPSSWRAAVAKRETSSASSSHASVSRDSRTGSRASRDHRDWRLPSELAQRT
eukprot:scaffold34584_cov87-Phaeocystis_antarctica.AAC.4